MPITKSAVREIRRQARKTERNRLVVGQMRLAIRDVRHAKTASEGQQCLVKAFKMIDQTASKRIIHRSTANRLKSRLSKFVAKLKP